MTDLHSWIEPDSWHRVMLHFLGGPVSRARHAQNLHIIDCTGAVLILAVTFEQQSQPRGVHLSADAPTSYHHTEVLCLEAFPRRSFS